MQQESLLRLLYQQLKILFKAASSASFEDDLNFQFFLLLKLQGRPSAPYRMLYAGSVWLGSLIRSDSFSADSLRQIISISGAENPGEFFEFCLQISNFLPPRSRELRTPRQAQKTTTEAAAGETQQAPPPQHSMITIEQLSEAAKKISSYQEIFDRLLPGKNNSPAKAAAEEISAKLCTRSPKLSTSDFLQSLKVGKKFQNSDAPFVFSSPNVGASNGNHGNASHQPLARNSPECTDTLKSAVGDFFEELEKAPADIDFAIQQLATGLRLDEKIFLVGSFDFEAKGPRHSDQVARLKSWITSKYLIAWLLEERPSSVDRDAFSNLQQAPERDAGIEVQAISALQARLNLLVTGLSVSTQLGRLCWEMVEHLVVHCRELALSFCKGNGFDCLLLCIVYAVTRLFGDERSFREIITAFKKDLFSLDDATYLRIRVESSSTNQEMDILRFYNQHFLPETKEYLQQAKITAKLSKLKDEGGERPESAQARLAAAQAGKRIVYLGDNVTIAISPKKRAASIGPVDASSLDEQFGEAAAETPTTPTPIFRYFFGNASGEQPNCNFSPTKKAFQRKLSFQP